MQKEVLERFGNINKDMVNNETINPDLALNDQLMRGSKSMPQSTHLWTIDS